MAIINIFNKDKKDKAQKPKAKKTRTARAKVAEKKDAVKKTEKTAMPAAPKKELDKVYRIIRNPHVTEKATVLTEKNYYVFKVEAAANKNDVKKAVSDYYNVEVLDVKMVNIPSRIRKRGKGVSIKRGYKKAIVKIKEGQKIEVLPR